MTNSAKISAALRQIARGFDALAAAIAGDRPSQDMRTAALLAEWGEVGLTRAEASAVFRNHGFAPQTAGGWARGDWIESRPDGRRYVTKRSRQWLAEHQQDRG